MAFIGRSLQNVCNWEKKRKKNSCNAFPLLQLAQCFMVRDTFQASESSGSQAFSVLFMTWV